MDTKSREPGRPSAFFFKIYVHLTTQPRTRVSVAFLHDACLVASILVLTSNISSCSGAHGEHVFDLSEKHF